MPGTVDDFIQRFGGNQTMDEADAAHYFDRFASRDPRDDDFDHHAMAMGATEYLGRLPEPQFQQAAQTAYSNASPDQREGLVGTLMRALQGRGVNLGSVLGQNVSHPSQVNASQYAQIANYARQQHPDAMQQVVREQPWLMKAMGHPVMMGALGMIAGHMIKKRTQGGQVPQQSSAGGLLGRLF
ncbi:MAG: hypothetical protein ABIZ04_04755 [Opitutus sp.]